MESRTKFFVAIIVILSFTILVFIILNANVPNNQSSETNSLEQCNIIANNGENKIDIVFFGSEKQSTEWSNYLIESKPFNQYKDSFNFYYINDYEVECELYQGIAILCHSRDLIKKAASCPNDYIIVLKKDSRAIRSSSYKNVMSINTAHPKTVLLHEFGHSFANLAEEYTPANIPRGSKNCVSECSDFPDENGKIDGCFQQCSKSNYYRSIAEGVMRTLSTPNFGIFNERNIIELIEKAINSRPILTGQITGFQIDETNTFNSCKDESFILAESNKNPEIHPGCSSNQDSLELGAGEFYQETDGQIGQSFNNIIFAEGPTENNDVTGEQILQEGNLITAQSGTTQVNIIDSITGKITETFSLTNAGEYLCLE